MPEPIMVACEGAGCPGAGGIYIDTTGALGLVSICSMCGNYVPVDDDAHVVAHDRKDILAMLARGDFASHKDGSDRG